MRNIPINIPEGEPGWSIYEVSTETVIPGAEATVWVNRDSGKGDEWNVQLYAYQDREDGKVLELTACATPLREALWQVINGYAMGPDGEGPAEKALLTKLEPPYELEALKETLVRALAYIAEVEQIAANRQH